MNETIDIREKFGDWFLDIAKYGVTVLILSPMFSEIGNRWLILGAVLLIAASLIMSVLMYNKKPNNKKPNNKTK